jgi:hypothetical protein
MPEGPSRRRCCDKSPPALEKQIITGGQELASYMAVCGKMNNLPKFKRQENILRRSLNAEQAYDVWVGELALQQDFLF